MNKQQKEVLLITQEECAEVTQAISKIFRFGIDGSYKEITNRERLTEEAGDLHCMIELLLESGLINRKELLNASGLKRHKLIKLSNIFDKEEAF